MGSHIATTDTFFIDNLQIKSQCPICGVDCTQDIGWIGERCHNCKTVYDRSELYWGEIARLRRQLLGLNRKQMAELTGYSKKTIKTYEFGNCSKSYYYKTNEVIKQNFIIG